MVNGEFRTFGACERLEQRGVIPEIFIPPIQNQKTI